MKTIELQTPFSLQIRASLFQLIGLIRLYPLHGGYFVECRIPQESTVFYIPISVPQHTSTSELRKILWGDSGGTAGSIFSLVAREHFASFQDGVRKN